MIEYLDKVGVTGDAEQWLVRRDGRLATAYVYFDEDRPFHDQVASHSAHWIGFEHPHVSPLLEITHAERLIIITGDERGPNLLQMAHKLEDLRERETWALSELAGLAEGIAMMQWREKGLIHRRADPFHMIVGGDGHARLRAPISEVTHGPARGYLGRGKISVGLGWMSPEQVSGVSLTPASDVFQLASVAYAALALKRPFTGQNDFEQLVAIRDAVPPPLPPTTNGSIAELILANLARDRSERLQSAGEFAAALRALVREAPPNLLAKAAALRGDHKPAPNRSAGIVGYRCPKQWSELTPTAADGVRHCASCDHEVVQVRSIDAVIPLLGKRCISYEPE